MLTWRTDADTGGFHHRGFLNADNGALVNATLEQRAQRIGKDPATGVWGSAEARHADSCNLVGLCWSHHHLVHEGDWIIDGNPDVEITFTSPYGRTLTSRPRPLDPRVRRRAQDASGTDLRATGTDPPR